MFQRLLGISLVLTAFASPAVAAEPAKRPNILFAIADDWSYPYAGAYGSKFVKTPAFDRVAKEGVLFTNAHSASPGCSPSRAALLTGKQPWQLEQAGTHASSFPKHLQVYPDLLENSGYFVGFTGKGWGPGNWKVTERPRNPAGPAFAGKMLTPPYKGVAADDYNANFKDFLAKKPKDKPFCFWYGGKEPHRAYEKGAGLKAGKKLEDAEVPAFLPDTKEIRSDLLDYALEIEWFDKHLGLMMKQLEDAGELENTIVVVTGDNGMPFPRAKANLYDHGTHLPLAIRWPARVKGGRTVEDFASLIDLAPTFLDAAEVKKPEMTGKSLLPLLTSGKQGQVESGRDRVFTGRERHSSARKDNLGYPCRAMHTAEYVYIRNFAPDRWPAGDPKGVEGDAFGYYDIDGAPSKTFLYEQRESKELGKFFQLAVAKRPAEELFDAKKDPANLVNLADKAEFAAIKKKLAAALETHLKETKDPHALGKGDVWETYPRYSPIRKFD